MSANSEPLKTNSIESTVLLKILLLFSFLFLIVMLVTTAWITEDAFITFRSINNFISGEGLTWNLGERVQVFTHPLWFFLISLFSFFTGEYYYTTLILSFLLSLLAISLFYLNTPNKLTFFLLLIIMPLSKAFTDYSTSGLENPLSHLLIVIFYVLFVGNLTGKKRILYLFLTASMILLNRMDLILLILPVLVYELYKNKRCFLSAAAGLLPFLIWEIFSLLYFGYLFPNTAYAKLNTGIASGELIIQGLYYFYHSINLDPVTVVILLAGILTSLINKRQLLFGAGMLLYILYLIKIGGDFHSGRFLSPLFISSLLLLSSFQMKLNYNFLFFFFLVILLNILSPFPFYKNDASYGTDTSIFKPLLSQKTLVRINDNGISDERSSLFRYTGLLNNLAEKKLYQHPWVQSGKAAEFEKNKVIVRNNIGLYGFFIDPRIYLVDPYALTDPLLSRLPSTEYWRIGHEWNGIDKKWRIGHFARKIPQGYLDALESDNPDMIDPYLREYYKSINTITRGDFWDPLRFKEIIRMNTGHYENLISLYPDNSNK